MDGATCSDEPTAEGFYLVRQGACRVAEVAKVGKFEDGSDWWIHFWCHKEADPMKVSDIENGQFYGPIEWPEESRE